MSNPPLAFQNAILSALPLAAQEMLRPELSPVNLVLRQTLHERGSRVHDVYFLEGGLASLTADTSDGGEVEVGLTGREGMVGSSLVLNPSAVAVHRAFTQVPGLAYRISSVAFLTAMDHSPELRDRCRLYVQFLMVQASQAAACNARHSLPARLA